MTARDRILGDRTIEELSPSECVALLAGIPVGRIVFLDGEQPVALPFNYAVHDGSVVFKTVAGSRVDAVREAGEPVSFEVDEYDTTRFVAWSVLVKGHLELVSEPEQVAELERVGLYSWLPDLSGRRWVAETAAWEPVGAQRWIRVRTGETTGRRTSPA